jgi:hypothetical protein
MRKRIAALCLALLLLCGGALADGALQPGNAFWIIADSDTRLLTEDELWAYSRETLRYIRNELLARHGYTFPNEDQGAYREYYSAFDWYKGVEDAPERFMTPTERRNLDLIRDMEALLES